MDWLGFVLGGAAVAVGLLIFFSFPGWAGAVLGIMTVLLGVYGIVAALEGD